MVILLGDFFHDFIRSCVKSLPLRYLLSSVFTRTILQLECCLGEWFGHRRSHFCETCLPSSISTYSRLYCCFCNCSLLLTFQMKTNKRCCTKTNPFPSIAKQRKECFWLPVINWGNILVTIWLFRQYSNLIYFWFVF